MDMQMPVLIWPGGRTARIRADEASTAKLGGCRLWRLTANAFDEDRDACPGRWHGQLTSASRSGVMPLFAAIAAVLPE
jgi:hypothetical protein